jgi:hypothetical protein
LRSPHTTAQESGSDLAVEENLRFYITEWMIQEAKPDETLFGPFVCLTPINHGFSEASNSYFTGDMTIETI